MDAATEGRLLQMLYKHDITECLTRYCPEMDRLDEKLLLAWYHADAVDDHGAFVSSPVEFSGPY